jgi:hypothetical protein
VTLCASIERTGRDVSEVSDIRERQRTEGNEREDDTENSRERNCSSHRARSAEARVRGLGPTADGCVVRSLTRTHAAPALSVAFPLALLLLMAAAAGVI